MRSPDHQPKQLLLQPAPTLRISLCHNRLPRLLRPPSPAANPQITPGQHRLYMANSQSTRQEWHLPSGAAPPQLLDHERGHRLAHAPATGSGELLRSFSPSPPPPITGPELSPPAPHRTTGAGQDNRTVSGWRSAPSLHSPDCLKRRRDAYETAVPHCPAVPAAEGFSSRPTQ